MKFSVYADGSSGGNSTGACGWGWVILGDGKMLAYGRGGLPVGTNNLAELMGAREGLRTLFKLKEYLESSPGSSTELVCDSQYVLGLANGSYSPTKNIPLAEHVRDMCRRHCVATRWVKGHSGDYTNEICDRLAKAGKAVFAGQKETKRNKRKQLRRKMKADKE